MRSLAIFQRGGVNASLKRHSSHRAAAQRLSQENHKAYGSRLNDIIRERESIFVGGNADVTFSTGGHFAHLASGSAICAHGGSVVHAAVSTEENGEATSTFLPLTVEYRSRSYAFGAIPQNSARRERHGTDDETLVSRAIDRAVRPLFSKGFVDQVQLTATTHSADGVHDPVVASVNAASLALLRAELPWAGPVGCVRIGLLDDVGLVLNPTVAQMSISKLDLLYAGTANLPLMMECSAHQVPESTIQAAMAMAQTAVGELAAAQKRILTREGLKVPTEKLISIELLADEDYAKDALVKDEASSAFADLKAMGSTTRKSAVKVPELMQKELDDYGHSTGLKVFRNHPGLTRKQRGQRESALQNFLYKKLNDPYFAFRDQPSAVKNMAVDSMMKKSFRQVYFDTGIRVDGRKYNAVRDIKCTTDVLPAVHGSSFFQRGDTHVLSTTTLGPRTDAKTVIPLNGSTNLAEIEQRFMLHYDFPGYCTNVIGKSGVNRRMIGHGALAEKALRNVLPAVADFPYAIRVFAECTSSSGSSSMASACSGTLALLDAGVPLLAPVAGVSVGVLAPENPDGSLDWQKNIILTDILGTEDYYGLMDFKVAGTEKGVTAFQMDMKCPGMPLQVLYDALTAARTGRVSILKDMASCCDKPRGSVKDTAPRVEIVTFDPERKRHLVGPGGEMVRHIETEYNVTIDTNLDGQAYIFGPDPRGVADARMLVQELVVDVAPGDVFAAEVLDVKDFGALVKITRAQEAILHMSELTHDSKLSAQSINSLIAPGQRIDVQVLSVDKALGAVRVSRKVLLDPSAVDSLSASSSDKSSLMVDLPTFPKVPPRRFSKEFFKDKVATQEMPETPPKAKITTSPLEKPVDATSPHVTAPPSATSGAISSEPPASESIKAERKHARPAKVDASTPSEAPKEPKMASVPTTVSGQPKTTNESPQSKEAEYKEIESFVQTRYAAKVEQDWAAVARATKVLRDTYGVTVRDGIKNTWTRHSDGLSGPSEFKMRTPTIKPAEAPRKRPDSGEPTQKNKGTASAVAAAAASKPVKTEASKPASPVTNAAPATNVSPSSEGQSNNAAQKSRISATIDAVLNFVGFGKASASAVSEPIIATVPISVAPKVSAVPNPMPTQAGRSGTSPSSTSSASRNSSSGKPHAQRYSGDSQRSAAKVEPTTNATPKATNTKQHEILNPEDLSRVMQSRRVNYKQVQSPAQSSNNANSKNVESKSNEVPKKDI